VTPAQSAAAPAPRGAGLTLALICAAVFLTALDQTVVVTALTPIAGSAELALPNDLPSLSWVVSGYLLGYVIVMPLMGRVSDLWGRRRVLIGCLALFAVGSLLCALAITLGATVDLSWLGNIGIHNPNSAVGWLVAARFIQAVGGGAIVPVAIATAGDLFGDRRRIIALGMIGGITEAGGALGPLYGALILAKWHFLPDSFPNAWQWIFLLNLPLVAMIIIALIALWPRTEAQPAITRARIDWLGALILGGALLCTSLGLGQEAGAISALKDTTSAQNNPLLLVVALVLLIAFILYEARTLDPVIAPALFRSGAFSADAVFSLILGMALIVALVDIPIFMLTVFGTDHFLDAGLALLRLTVMIPIGAFAGGWLVTRFGTRPIGAAGAICTALGFFLMHRWLVTVSWGEITLGTVITGIGFGLIVAPISTTALNTTDRDRFGMAASIVTALRMIGMILGLALLSSWGLTRYKELANAIPGIKDVNDPKQVTAYQQAITATGAHVVTDLFFIGAILALAAVIPALLLWKPKPGEQGNDEVAVFSMGL
jgi:MFS family permease